MTGFPLHASLLLAAASPAKAPAAAASAPALPPLNYQPSYLTKTPLALNYPWLTHTLAGIFIVLAVFLTFLDALFFKSLLDPDYDNYEAKNMIEYFSKNLASPCGFILLAFQTTKQEGLSGTIGGRVESAYRPRLGFDQQLARLTSWVAIAFVFFGFLVSLSGI